MSVSSGRGPSVDGGDEWTADGGGAGGGSDAALLVNSGGGSRVVSPAWGGESGAVGLVALAATIGASGRESRCCFATSVFGDPDPGIPDEVPCVLGFG